MSEKICGLISEAIWFAPIEINYSNDYLYDDVLLYIDKDGFFMHYIKDTTGEFGLFSLDSVSKNECFTA